MFQQPVPPREERSSSTPRRGLTGRLSALREFFLDPPGPDPVLCGPPAGQPTLFEHVGSFLAINGLEPTPANYQLAYQVIRADGDGLAATDRPENRPAAPAPAAPVTEVDPEAQATLALIAGLLGGARQAMGKVNVIVRESGDQVRAYGDALETSVEVIDDIGPAQALEALVELTRAMITRARHAETRLQDMGEEIDQLQTNLAEARSLASRDTLTGLPNRAAIEERLDEALLLARKLQRPLALAYCDVDHFKRINDEFGHAVGDRVLKLVVDAMIDGGGRDTFIGRHGGEEFLMLFEGLTAVEAAARVDEIRDSLFSRTLRLREGDHPIGHVSFSAGVARLLADDQRDTLLARADEGLLRAKREGRNRVVIEGKDIA